MASNHALALSGGDVVATALGIERLAPDSMTGSMTVIALPGSKDDASARSLQRTLTDLDRIQVPITPWPVPAARPAGVAPAMRLLRVSAQLYNEPSDFERLAAVLPGRLAAE